MTTALMTSPPCLIVHVDRYLQLESGTIIRCTSHVDLETEVAMPAFSRSDTRTALTGYIPVAAAAHMGQDKAGHWQAILKGQPMVTMRGKPAAWLMTNDEISPEPIWQIPSWLASSLTEIWMIRTDCLMLQRFADHAQCQLRQKLQGCRLQECRQMLCSICCERSLGSLMMTAQRPMMK